MHSKVMVKTMDNTVEVVLKTYENTQHWINLADTKAGLVLTITGIVSGFMIPQMVLWKQALVARSVVPWIVWGGGGFLGLYFIFQIASFLYTIQVFFPRTADLPEYKKTSHIFPVGICLVFPKTNDCDKLWQEYRQLHAEDLKREYVYQLHTDSLVCTRKYKSLRAALKNLLWSIGFAFLTSIITGIFFQ